MLAFDADACGNTFLVLWGSENEEPTLRQHLHNLRENGAWSFDNGVLLIRDRDHAAVRTHFIEPDGSEFPMCGNGARAAAAALIELGSPPILNIGNTTVPVERIGEHRYRVPMRPVVRGASFAVALPGTTPNARTEAVRFARYRVCGEPHAVALVSAIDGIALERWGERLAPETNCTFASITNGNDGIRVRARTFERGIMRETRSCGTGACAIAAALIERNAVLPGAVRVAMYEHELIVHPHARTPTMAMCLEGDAVVKRKEFSR